MKPRVPIVLIILIIKQGQNSNFLPVPGLYNRARIVVIIRIIRSRSTHSEGLQAVSVVTAIFLDFGDADDGYDGTEDHECGEAVKTRG